MLWLKGCPRCTGDLYGDRDQYGLFITCVQCGFSKDIMERLAEPLSINLDPMPPPVAPKSEGGKRRRLSHGGRPLSWSLGRTGNTPNRFAA
jgi:hypothetical protein